MTRRIAVFTSSRADLGPLDPVIRALDDSEDVELVVIASGTHSNAAFGGRITDINVRDRNSVALVESGFGATSAAALAEAFAQISSGVSKVLADRRVDLILVLGDRWELLGVASAALLHGVPIAHLHGGEITEGAIDERIRHAITKLADLHLCATTDSARRIRQLGEPPWRVKVVGAPGLDRFREASTMSDRDLGALLGSPLQRPFGVVVYHPQTVDRTDVAARAEVVLSIAADTLGSVLVLHPGADPGSDAIVEVITSMAAQRGNVVHLRNAGEDYVGILSAADVLVGNSSSGIIEAASIPLAVVDVGDRQRGRAHGANVIHVETEAEAIREGIRTALSAEFRARWRRAESLRRWCLERTDRDGPDGGPPRPSPLQAAEATRPLYARLGKAVHPARRHHSRHPGRNRGRCLSERFDGGQRVSTRWNGERRRHTSGAPGGGGPQDCR